jgi:hypothetical protein
MTAARFHSRASTAVHDIIRHTMQTATLALECDRGIPLIGTAVTLSSRASRRKSIDGIAQHVTCQQREETAMGEIVVGGSANLDRRYWATC